MPDKSYTVINDHVIISPGRPDEIDITERGRECEWCVKTYPSCGSDSPHRYCRLFILPGEYLFVTGFSGVGADIG